MDDQEGLSGLWTRIAAIVVALAVLAVLMLPSVRGVLNRIPYFWEVLYPLLALYAAYLVVSTIVAKEGIVTVLKFTLLLVAAIGVTIHTLGGARPFFTVGRWSAILFIVAEVIHTAVDAVRGEAEAA